MMCDAEDWDSINLLSFACPAVIPTTDSSWRLRFTANTRHTHAHNFGNFVIAVDMNGRRYGGVENDVDDDSTNVYWNFIQFISMWRYIYANTPEVLERQTLRRARNPNLFIARRSWSTLLFDSFFFCRSSALPSVRTFKCVFVNLSTLEPTKFI